MQELRKWTVDSYGYYRPANACDRSWRELEKFYSLYYHFCNYDLLYATKNGKFEKFTFNQLMEGISRFYHALINAPKNNQFKKERQFFLSLKEIYKPLGEKYEE